MKKSLLALAALSVFATAAQAQSSVTVYGIMDIGVTNTKDTWVDGEGNTNDGAGYSRTVKNSGNGDGGLSTSRLGFRGTEDLGGGNKANFQLEYDLKDVGTGASSLGARYSWVGLESNNMGQVRLGRQEQSIHSVIVGGSAGMANNVAGTIYSAGSTDSGNTNHASIRPHGVFVDRAVTYISPNFNGVTVELQTASYTADDEVAGTYGKDKQDGFSVKYAAGKLNVAFAQQTQKSTTDFLKTGDGQTVSGDKRKTTAYAASYDFGVIKAFAMRTNDKLTDSGFNVRDLTANEIGAQMPMGKVTLFASMFRGKGKGELMIDSDNAEYVEAGKVKGQQIGALYSLSKRTTAYAIYGQQQATEYGEPQAEGDSVKSKSTSIGIRHAF